MPERIINLSMQVSKLASQGAEDIRAMTNVTNVLSINALIISPLSPCCPRFPASARGPPKP